MTRDELEAIENRAGVTVPIDAYKLLLAAAQHAIELLGWNQNYRTLVDAIQEHIDEEESDPEKVQAICDLIAAFRKGEQ